MTRNTYEFSCGVGYEIPGANERAPDDYHSVEEHEEAEGNPGAVSPGAAGFFQPLQEVVCRRFEPELRGFFAGDRMVPGAENAVTELALQPARLGVDEGGAVVGRRPEQHRVSEQVVRVVSD